MDQALRCCCWRRCCCGGGRQRGQRPPAPRHGACSSSSTHTGRRERCAQGQRRRCQWHHARLTGYRCGREHGSHVLLLLLKVEVVMLLLAVRCCSDRTGGVLLSLLVVVVHVHGVRCRHSLWLWVARVCLVRRYCGYRNAA